MYSVVNQGRGQSGNVGIVVSGLDPDSMDPGPHDSGTKVTVRKGSKKYFGDRPNNPLDG